MNIYIYNFKIVIKLLLGELCQQQHFKRKQKKRLKDDTTKLHNTKGLELLSKFSKEAQSNQISNMTLDEINDEIEKYRAGE